MLTTRNIIIDYKDVPSTWIFEHYCNLDQKLNGQDVKIKSMFNTADKIPSMCIYYDKINSVYKFKDFSSGKSGGGANLLMYLYKLTFADAAFKLINDYKEYIKNNTKSDVKIKEYSKFKVTDFSVKTWSVLDRDFWVRYNIGTTLLNKYNVKPLNEYTMSKEEDGRTETITISGDYLYGYFKTDGTLYKIYQPKNKKKKFIKVKSYIQGLEQCENHSHLLITSSLKDIMSIKSLGVKIDCIAADSENTFIPKSEILKFIESYKSISVCFDNDDAGITSMQKYRELYGFNVFFLPLSKDVSDSIKEHGVKKVLYTFVPLLQRSTEGISL